jgi:hypothetical protein
MEESYPFTEKFECRMFEFHGKYAFLVVGGCATYSAAATDIAAPASAYF